MSKTTVHYEVVDRVAHVTLDRPEVGNALNEQMHAELGEVWRRTNEDDGVWSILLKGSGQDFCLGEDFTEWAEYAETNDMPPRWRAAEDWAGQYRGKGPTLGFPEPSEGLPAKPLITAIQGRCSGSAMLFVAHSDFTICADDAGFSIPNVQYGLGAAEEIISLTRMNVSRAAISRLALLGETMPAERARELGLVIETVPAAQLQERAEELVTTLTRESAPLAVRGSKAGIWNTIDLPFDAGNRWAHEFLNEVRFRSEDSREGPRAFAEKRKPQWQAK